MRAGDLQKKTMSHGQLDTEGRWLLHNMKELWRQYHLILYDSSHPYTWNLDKFGISDPITHKFM